VAVEAASASGGFIMPNDHVDVVSSRQTNTGLISETIIHNVGGLQPIKSDQLS
jgi:pilus assembly protein CpaB